MMDRETRHRLPSLSYSMYANLPSDLPDKYIFEWVIGHFFKNFNALETALTEWIVVAIHPLDRVFGYVALRDTHFMHKIRNFDFLILKKMTYTGNPKSAKKLFEKINGIRNQLAHGALEFKKSKNIEDHFIAVSMPSNDFLVSGSRKKYTCSEINNLCTEMFFIIQQLQEDADNHSQKINEKRYKKLD
jgi:hypothetical protein